MLSDLVPSDISHEKSSRFDIIWGSDLEEQYTETTTQACYGNHFTQQNQNKNMIPRASLMLHYHDTKHSQSLQRNVWLKASSNLLLFFSLSPKFLLLAAYVILYMGLKFVYISSMVQKDIHTLWIELGDSIYTKRWSTQLIVLFTESKGLFTWWV